jgi:oligopeptide transport system permease protein
MSSTADLTAAELDRYADLLAEAKSIKGVSLGKDAWRRLRKSYAAMASLGFLITIGLLALMTPLLPLQSPVQQDLSNRQFLAPNTGPMSLDLVKLIGEEKYDDQVKTLFNNPNAFDRMLIRIRLAIFGDWCIPSICGTDNLGQDIFARLFWGARVSLIVGIVATLVSLAIGVSYGAIAGYFGGHVDNVMMRIVDVLYSIPFIFVVIFLMTFLNAPEIKATMREYNIDQIMVFYLVIGAIYWLTMSRVVRGQVISIKNEQFVEAARTIGATRMRIIFRHLVPNLLSIVIVYLSLTIPAVMLFEAFLSFLGLGVSPPDVSWGLLANDGLKVITPIKIYWWLVLFPGLALALTLFALNFLGDGLRDALDPRMKNR